MSIDFDTDVPERSPESSPRLESLIGRQSRSAEGGPVPTPPPADAAAHPAADDSALSEDDPAEIAYLISTMLRSLAGLKAHLTSADGEANAIFLVAALVKGGPKRASELAGSMCTDPSTVSRQVAGLVKHGLIERQADAADGRASILVPTELGQERVRDFAATRSLAMGRLLAAWTPSDRATFARLLRAYNTELEAHREELLSVISSSAALTKPALSARSERFS